MNDFGKEFSIIHRYSRVYMSKMLMEYNIPGRAVPYFMEICAHPGISQEQIAKNLKIVDVESLNSMSHRNCHPLILLIDSIALIA